jgi:tRNA nucleotidyltransferase (CCA-adding enzyme)
MESYLVGGCVRDQLLGLEVKDRDWVVVGSTVKEMLAQGYQAVGKDFPVFLHPQTHEEYALARTERKTAPGYKGFTVHADPKVTLEEDLLRRDLTINAIAQKTDGTLVDPYDGQQDLKDKILRHVSPAFVEDPVRVLRIARFAARFNFTIADETKALISQMIEQGELEHLVAERVWQEMVKALSTDKPSLFFTTLRELGALKIIFPEIERLFGVPQTAQWHPEVDTGAHVMMVIDQAAKLSDDLAVRFAALCHDLGKGTTKQEILPKHIGHEKRSVDLTKALCERLRVPNDIKDLALKVAEFHGHVHKLNEMRPKTIVSLLEKLDLFRRPEKLDPFCLACLADARGRLGYENIEVPEIELLKTYFEVANQIIAKPFVEQGLKGKAISEAVHKKRVEVVSVITNPL